MNLKDTWKGITIKLEQSCEFIENRFTDCVGEKISKCIGDFFLLSFLVSRPRMSKENEYKLVESEEMNVCHVNNERANKN